MKLIYMDTHIWFRVSISPQQEQKIISQLIANGFEKQNDFYKDSNDRRVRIAIEPSRIEIGISHTDVVDEQEQLEFILTCLSLEEQPLGL